MQSFKIGPFTQRIDSDNQIKLGINTQLPSSGFSLRGLEFDKQRKALLIDPENPDSIDYWEADQLSQVGKTLIITGPWLDLKSLSEVFSLPNLDRKVYLFRWLKAIKVVNDYPEYQSPVFGGNWFFLDDGRVLVLPTPWGNQILHSLSDEKQRILATQLSLVKKNSNWLSMVLFAFATLWYRIEADDMPFPLKDLSEEARGDHSQLKLAGMFEPLELRVKNPNPATISVISRILNLDEKITIEEIEPVLLKPGTETFTKNQIAKNKKHWEKAAKRFGILENYRKKRTKIVLVFLSILITLGISVSIVQRVLEPPLSLGLEPQEVVHVYFDAVNQLEPEILDKLIVDGAGRPLRRTVVQLFTTSRVREAYEMRKVILNPQQWKDLGEPELTDATMVFGIDDLRIINVRRFPGDKGESVIVRVEFDYYIPDSGEVDSMEPVSSFIIEEIVQDVHLRLHKNAWFIYLFEDIFD